MSDPEIVEQVVTKAGRAEQQTRYRETGTEGVRVTDEFLSFLRQAAAGKLPNPGDVPTLDPQIIALAEELAVVHLPEWRNPAGRKLAEPCSLPVPQAPRLAQYLFARGVRIHPELETVRWRPTPGGPPGPYDPGMHIYPDEDGIWPDPDPEAFWDIAHIEVAHLEDGSWAARHPRGITYQAPTKSEAYEGIVARLRAKIEEANNGMDG